MNLNFIPHNIFQAAYRASNMDTIWISQAYAENRHFSVVENTSPANLAELAQNLNDYYEVADAASMIDAIQIYMTAADFDAVVLALFRVAFAELGSDFINLTAAQFTERYLTEAQILAHTRQTEYNAEDLSKLHEFASRYYFNPEKPMLPNIANFLAQTQDLFALCPKSATTAFDTARIVQIITNCYAVGYIDAEECEQLLAKCISWHEPRFQGFDEYIASFLLGRAYFSLERGETDIATAISEHATIYQILFNAPYDVFAASGLWADTLTQQKARIAPLLQRYANHETIAEQIQSTQTLKEEMLASIAKNGGEAKLFERTLDEFIRHCYQPAKLGRADSLFENGVDSSLITPLDEMNGDISLYAYSKKFCDKYKITLANDEYPIMYSDATLGGKRLITNRAIYAITGMLMFKKLVRTEWKDTTLSAAANDTASVIVTYCASPKLSLDIDAASYAKAYGIKDDSQSLAPVAQGVAQAFQALRAFYTK